MGTENTTAKREKKRKKEKKRSRSTWWIHGNSNGLTKQERKKEKKKIKTKRIKKENRSWIQGYAYAEDPAAKSLSESFGLSAADVASAT